MKSSKMIPCLNVVLLILGIVCKAAAAPPSEPSAGRGSGLFETQDTPDIHQETEVRDVAYDQFVYSPHIVINPPRFSTAGVAQACCNCSTIQDIVSAETAKLEAASRRLRDETRRHLQQLQDAMSDLAKMLGSLPDPVATLPTSPDNQTPATASTTMPSSMTTKSVTPTKTTASPPTTETLLTTRREVKTTTKSATTTTQTMTRPEAKTTTKPTTTTTHTTTQTVPTTTTEPATKKPLLFKDCAEGLELGVTESGVYQLQPRDNGPQIEVYCDMDTDGGGWTVFQRRRDGSVDFFRDFATYRRGFGDVEGEFWLGNDNLHRLTSQDEYTLRVDLTDFEDDSKYAAYNAFGVADLSDDYRLTLGRYSGTAGDSLSRHNQKPFTTKDADNDEFLTGNCAQLYRGAWWYERCHQSNLNGNYLRGPTNKYAQGVIWRRWKGYNYSLKTSEMKFRPKT